jgi:hypothetical protein
MNCDRKIVFNPLALLKMNYICSNKYWLLNKLRLIQNQVN